MSVRPGLHLLQADVECEFGYEFVNHECRLIESMDTSQCSAVTAGRYHMSKSKHRLVSGDVCSDVSRVISDTDGKGNLPGGPGSAHGHRGRAARAFVVILVRCSCAPGDATPVNCRSIAGPAIRETGCESDSQDVERMGMIFLRLVCWRH